MALADASQGLPLGMAHTVLAPGRLAKLTAQQRARLLKRTPKGLIPTAPFKAATPNTVLD